MSAIGLEAHGVTFAYGKGEPVVCDVDFRIGEGEVVGLVGESGSGKSTLARLLVGLHEPAAGEISRPQLRHGVQMIFQDPYAALNPRLTAFSAVFEAARIRDRLSRPAARERAVELLTQVGLSDAAMQRRPSRLSGGQCQRVSIARALAARPAILVADEPTSNLDVSVQAQILNLIRALQQEHKLSVVLVSHDLAVVRYMAERTYIMYRGEIVEDGPTEVVYTAPRHPYTASLIGSARTGGQPKRVGVHRNLDIDPASR